MLQRTFALAASLAVGALLLLAGSASAHGGDRNRDRIPDRWEKQHHLSLKVKQTRRDQDHDGLNNLGEWRSHTDPRNADSDDDGIKDDDENAGTVDSFTDGVLTITLGKGGTLTGRVSDDTEIECDGDAKATASGGGDDDHNRAAVATTMVKTTTAMTIKATTRRAAPRRSRLAARSGKRS